MKKLPYKDIPYSKRNWGNNWHSLCSYHGKLKPSIAHHLVDQFTDIGDLVLDPMSGVGTIPLEACLQGRVGIGNDMSELAYIVTKAKVGKVSKESVYVVIERLENYILKHKNEYINENELPYQDFGLNGRLPEYFHKDTYIEILCARAYFKDKKMELSNEEAVVFSCLLHVLHGNRPYALSRQSHPLTPYSPKGDFIYKNVIVHIKNKVELVYKNESEEVFTTGNAIYGDLFDLDSKVGKVDAIITSPPFFDSIRFYISNWMRLWLTGWEPGDFKREDDRFIESKQKRSLDIYNDLFDLSSKLLKDKGIMIMHLGKSKKCDMALELANRAGKYFLVVNVMNEDSSSFEKHGILDKGATVEHQFLFLQKL